MRTRSLGVMVALMVTGCAPERGPVNCNCISPLIPVADIEGVWSYSAARLVMQDGVWVEFDASPPILVRARMEESRVAFETLVEPRVVQAFRTYARGTIENDIVSNCCGTYPRETYDDRPWQEHNGFHWVWIEAQLPPPIAVVGAIALYPTISSIDTAFEIPHRDAAGQAMRWTLPGAVDVQTCDEPNASCSTRIEVRHSFTRVTSP